MLPPIPPYIRNGLNTLHMNRRVREIPQQRILAARAAHVVVGTAVLTVGGGAGEDPGILEGDFGEVVDGGTEEVAVVDYVAVFGGAVPVLRGEGKGVVSCRV